MNRAGQTLHFTCKLQKMMVAILLASFFLAALHASMDNKFDHAHDSSCSVYVLEELSFNADALALTLVTLLFIPYVFLLFTPTYKRVKVEKHFAIRAPPSF